MQRNLPAREATGLNVSGDIEIARIIRGGAIHYSRGQRTTVHSEYAWKLHVGIDAPVWLRAAAVSVDAHAGARVVVTPPGAMHATGAVGWSCAIFVAPGTIDTPLRATTEALVLDGAAANAIVAVCQGFNPTTRADTHSFIAEVVARVAPLLGEARCNDRRVPSAIRSLERNPHQSLTALAQAQHLSLDRLARLVRENTGMRLRQLVLWNRLMNLLSSDRRYASLAQAAVDNGFADHGHLTRTYRAYLGRAPSDFREAPDVVAPWSALDPRSE
jgi:AraC-like DNA-binding protein